jgi:N-methylhydantoinase B
VTGGYITAATAERVYGVRVADGAVDAYATEALRTQAFSERVGRPATPQTGPPPGLHPIADALGVDALGAGEGRIRCACCGAGLCAADGDYKDAAVLRERPMPALAPEFAGDDVEMAGQMVFREFCCPACGVRFDTEIARATDPPLWDVRLAAL